ncbi:MAG TPA: phosphomannomutase, partial [Synergistaceae bacterium]|nr:phosphomannomutase [Synergistaceae bacterium]
LLGMVTSPMLYWSSYHLKLRAGVMVTGSHNPKDMNGLKLAFDGATLYGADIQELLRMITSDESQAAER